MQRHELMDMLAQLQLAGMRAHVDDIDLSCLAHLPPAERLKAVELLEERQRR